MQLWQHTRPFNLTQNRWKPSIWIISVRFWFWYCIFLHSQNLLKGRQPVTIHSLQELRSKYLEKLWARKITSGCLSHRRDLCKIWYTTFSLWKQRKYMRGLRLSRTPKKSHDVYSLILTSPHGCKSIAHIWRFCGWWSERQAVMKHARAFTAKPYSSGSVETFGPK